MKIGIYGGTFNPVHNGHIKAVNEAVFHLGLDKVLLIPTYRPPHKELPQNAPTPQMRLKMLRLAVIGIPAVHVSDIELRRKGISYTADTIGQIQAQYPAAELFLLMGADLFLDFESWYNFNWIINNVTIGVWSRDHETEIGVKKLEEGYGARIQIIKNDPMETSSTQIRRLLPERMGREYLDERVYGAIIRQRLYGALPEYDWLYEKAFPMMKKKRIPHVKGCETEAVFLAKRWGANIDDARTAAILHDITKKETPLRQLQLCEKYGIILDDAEKNEPKLLHAKTGAVVAKAKFGVSDQIHDAIYWHTTGRPDMSLLEKILYLADYIEPTRQFPELLELRHLSYEDIDAGLLMGLTLSVKDMRDRGIVPHEMTERTIDWLRNCETIT